MASSPIGGAAIGTALAPTRGPLSIGFKEETMRIHTTHALLGGLAAIAAMAALNASAQSSGRQPSTTQSPSTPPSGTQAPSSQSSHGLSSGTRSSEDSRFLEEAIRGNLAEVQMGQLAKERSQNKDVRDYGQMLIDDHSKGNEKAMAAAKSMNVPVPTEPSAKQKQQHDMMAKLSGSQFDTMFMSHMVQDHEEDIGKYNAQAQSGDSSKATDYAKDSLSVLHSHLSKAQSIESKLSDRTSSNDSPRAPR
jgi:putative membrane protein